MIAAIIVLSFLVLVSFVCIGVLGGYLVRQYLEENPPVYTSHPELWDPETGKLIVDSQILAIRTERESGDNDY
jgi:hypothetical protein